MCETTEKTNKADLISEAVEAIDYFSDQNKTLKQQQKILFVVCGVLLLTTLYWRICVNYLQNMIYLWWLLLKSYTMRVIN